MCICRVWASVAMCRAHSSASAWLSTRQPVCASLECGLTKEACVASVPPCATYRVRVCVCVCARAQVPASTSDQVQDTFNRIGIALALAFLLPQFLLGWDAQESVTVVAPMCAGWFLFDLTFLAGLLLLVQFPSDDAR